MMNKNAQISQEQVKEKDAVEGNILNMANGIAEEWLFP